MPVVGADGTRPQRRGEEAHELLLRSHLARIRVRGRVRVRVRNRVRVARAPDAFEASS